MTREWRPAWDQLEGRDELIQTGDQMLDYAIGHQLAPPGRSSVRRARQSWRSVMRSRMSVASYDEFVPYDLDRFLVAQHDVYDDALEELRRGRKESHWMWFIFPQLQGLGSSPTSQRYAITSLGEAQAYLADPVLGTRLRACADQVLATGALTAEDIFGGVDAKKLRACMTLFERAAPDDHVFRQVLDRYYGGIADEATDALLESARRITRRC